MIPILQINNISRRYGGIQALDDFSLTVEPGTVYGILGPNGSGKTTLLSIILGIIRADRGSYEWFGEQPSSKLQQKIGSLLENPTYLPYLSAVKNLQISAAIKEVDPYTIDKALEIVNLTSRKHSPAQTYSLGMRQRLGLASALLGSPDVLVLDEPTNGLDPQGIYDVRKAIQAIAGQGKTILMASHILDEIEKVCTHVAILKNGKKLISGSTREILNKGDTLEIGAADLDMLRRTMSTIKGITDITIQKDILVASIPDRFDVAELNAELINNGIRPFHLVRKKQTLESQFIDITGGGL